MEEPLAMGARQKLNAAYFNICLLIAAATGLVFQSWLAFLVALASTLVSAAYGGGIRRGGGASPQGPK
jgi:4-hydroxybenzoate polyprenyltransferase